MKVRMRKKKLHLVFTLFTLRFAPPKLLGNSGFLFSPHVERRKTMKSTNQKNGFFKVRYLATTGILSALATVLMMISFSVPFMPSFIKLDLSELPALIASFSMGPIYGVLVCLIKNLINLPMTTTGGVGELANFLLGCCFVLPAGFVYYIRKSRLSALFSALGGAAIMSVVGLPLNYFVTYPAYTKLLPLDAIINMYVEIFPGVATLIPGADPLFTCLLVFNVPFTFLKGALVTVITFFIYKRISPLIKGKN